MATLTNSTVSDNGVIEKGLSTSDGGGIYNDHDGDFTISGSTLSGNLANIGGGGIYNRGSVTISSSTLSGNEAGNEFFGGHGGGGIYNDNGQAAIDSSTLYNNYGESSGDAIANHGEFARVSLHNSIVAVSTDGNNLNCKNEAGAALVSEGYNLDSADSCAFDSTGDIGSADPLLGPLHDNGEETYTHALLVGSPAIDAGNCPDLSTDQRGFPRPADMPGAVNIADGCDIGAFEYQEFSIINLPVIIRS